MKEALIGASIGVCAGALSGLFGIGGGLLIVPALVVLLGFETHKAIGTSLATLLAPVGIFAVLNYHKEGKVDWWVTLFMGCAFVAGALGGSRISLSLDKVVVERALAAFLVVVAVYLWFKPR